MIAMETPSRTISTRFAQDGFAVIDELTDMSTVIALREVYQDMIDGQVACPGTDRMLGGITRQVMLPHVHHPLYADNAAVRAARAIAKELVECDAPEFLFSMLIYKPPGHPHETPWHQDMAYAGKPVTPAGTIMPNKAIAQFWLALDDVDETMGCMEFVPEAQDRPMPEHYVAGGEPDDDGRLLAVRDPAKAWDLSRALRCPLKAGSATVHGYSTPHFTGPNRSDRPRRAYIFSFAHPQVVADVMARQALPG